MAAMSSIAAATAAHALAITLIAAAATPAAADDASETGKATNAWTLALPTLPGDPRHAVADRFARCVRDASVGKLILAPEAAPAPNALAGAVLAGAPRLATVALAAIPDPDPLFQLETVADLASDAARADKLWTAARLDLERALSARGFAFIFSAAAPPAGLFLPAQPDSRDALAKLRLAAPTVAGARLIATLGLDPVAVPEPADSIALAAALATGRIDGFAAEPTAEAAAAASTGMVFLDLAIHLPREVLVANRVAFEPLPADAKTALVACGDQAKAEAATALLTATTEARRALADRGVPIIAPSEALRADLAIYGAARLADWLQRTGVTGKAIIDAYRAM